MRQDQKERIEQVIGMLKESQMFFYSHPVEGKLQTCINELDTVIRPVQYGPHQIMEMSEAIEKELTPYKMKLNRITVLLTPGKENQVECIVERLFRSNIGASMTEFRGDLKNFESLLDRVRIWASEHYTEYREHHSKRHINRLFGFLGREVGYGF